MNPRRLIGGIAFGLLLLLALGSRYVPGLTQDDWGTWWNFAYVLAVGASLIAALYDRKNFPDKAWDFNPRRGLIYFFLGWLIFPVMIGLEAIFGTDFAFGAMVLGTLVLSVLVGILGTFTENVGV